MSDNRHKRILIIDDNAAIHDDFAKVLVDSKEASALDEVASRLFATGADAPAAPTASMDFELDFALQGADGYAKACQALEAGRPFSVAFVDMRMPPGWDGLETSRRLMETDPQLQIVICTAFSDYSWRDLTRVLGHSDRLVILKKPFDLVEVCQLASALTEKWRLARLADLRTAELERLVDDKTAELRATNEDLRRANDQLIRLYELESERNHLQHAVKAMSHVLGVIGHELRTPLAAIRATAELAAARGGGEPESPVKVIASTSASMAQMLDDMLEVARLNSGVACWHWGSVDLAQVCEDALSQVRPLVDSSRVRLNCNVETDQRVLGDQGAICRLILNLVTNALRHTDDGEIHVTARCFQRDAERWVEIAVRDTGSGIAPPILERLGEPFVLNRGIVGSGFIEGAGLGLSICRGIATAHGGTVEIMSEVGQGTTVSTLLRADLEEPAFGENAALV